MLKKLTSLALASALLLCPVVKLSHAYVDNKTVMKIAAILEENEDEFQQKLNLEKYKRQALKYENQIKKNSSERSRKKMKSCNKKLRG